MRDFRANPSLVLVPPMIWKSIRLSLVTSVLNLTPHNPLLFVRFLDLHLHLITHLLLNRTLCRNRSQASQYSQSHFYQNPSALGGVSAQSAKGDRTALSTLRRMRLRKLRMMLYGAKGTLEVGGACNRTSTITGFTYMGRRHIRAPVNQEHLVSQVRRNKRY